MLMPKPLRHSHGDVELHLTALKLQLLKDAARAAGQEVFSVVEAQLLSRLPGLPKAQGLEQEFKVKFLHKLELKGRWKPIRERNETYALRVMTHGITIDASTSWALANAMSTLYQLLAVKVSQNEVGWYIKRMVVLLFGPVLARCKTRTSKNTTTLGKT